MKTEGHLISDEQFEEYKKLKEDRESGKSSFSVKIERVQYAEGHRWSNMRELFEFNLDSNNKKDFTEVYDRIEETLNDNLKNSECIRDDIFEKLHSLEKERVGIDAKNKSVRHNIAEWKKLMKSSTVFEFIKNRKKLKKDGIQI